MCAFTGRLTFVGCEDCCDDVTTLEKKLHGYRKGYERLKAENRELWSIVAAAERDASRGFGAEVAKLRAEVAELKVKGEDLTLDVDEGRVLLARSHARRRKLEEEVEQLEDEVEQLKFDVDERCYERNKREDEAFSAREEADEAQGDLKCARADNERLKEQLLRLGAVPFAPE